MPSLTGFFGAVAWVWHYSSVFPFTAPVHESVAEYHRSVGTRSRISSSRFVFSSEVKRFKPVALPPGRLRLVTNPNFTGSSAARKTIGIVMVAALAASPEVIPPTAITATQALD